MASAMKVLNPFLKTGVIFASFKIEGNSPLSTQPLKKSDIASKISAFSFTILTGISAD